MPVGFELLNNDFSTSKLTNTSHFFSFHSKGTISIGSGPALPPGNERNGDKVTLTVPVPTSQCPLLCLNTSRGASFHVISSNSTSTVFQIYAAFNQTLEWILYTTARPNYTGSGFGMQMFTETGQLIYDARSPIALPVAQVSSDYSNPLPLPTGRKHGFFMGGTNAATYQEDYVDYINDTDCVFISYYQETVMGHRIVNGQLLPWAYSDISRSESRTSCSDYYFYQERVWPYFNSVVFDITGI